MIFDTNNIHNFAEFAGFQPQLLNQYSLVSSFQIHIEFLTHIKRIPVTPVWNNNKSPPSGIITKESTTEAFAGVSNEKSPILVTHFLGK